MARAKPHRCVGTEQTYVGQSYLIPMLLLGILVTGSGSHCENGKRPTHFH